MQPSMNTNQTDDEHILPSNNEIEILYDIVRQAQDVPESSSRALFTAYNTVLAEKGISSDDDTIIYRFLLCMQEDRKEPSFVQRFKRVLAEMDINVECDSDGEGVEEFTTNLDLEDATRNGEPLQNSVRIPSRRGSFDSFFDGTADKVAGTDVAHDVPFRSRRNSRDVASDVGGRRDKRRSRSDSDARGQLFTQLPIRNGMNGAGIWRTASEQTNPRPQRRGSVSTRGSIKITRNGYSGSKQLGDYDGDGDESQQTDQTDQTDSFDASNIRIPGVNAPIPGMEHDPDQVHEHMMPEAYRPSDTQMLDDAEHFEHQRIHSIARRCFQEWRSRTAEQARKNRDMAIIASDTDRKALLRQSLGSWQDALQQKRQDNETERFFGRLETRAEKARSIFLLTKAFTHWARSAEDEVQRTSVARRHILRTKYFKQWREITAVNEMKIQHFVLGKFLNKWRSRTSAIQYTSDIAVDLYQKNLKAKVHQLWLMHFFDRRAPCLYEERLKRKIFGQWSEITAVLKDREHWVTDNRDREVLHSTFNSLRQKAALVRSQEGQAQRFRQSKLISSAFSILQKEARLAPLLAQFIARSNMRIVQAFFQTWHRNSHLSRSSQSVDRKRILRNAFTAWNDRLRTKAIVDRINDRVIIETMYKWALASRVSLFRRVQDRKMKETAMATWIARTQERTNTLDVAERRFAQFKRTQTLRSCLRMLENATVAKKSLEFLANSVYQPKLKQRTLDKLQENLAHVQEMQEWSRNARFYVLTTHALKTWNEATLLSRRNRRRETYTQVRRTVKMNLVRHTFGIWKAKAAQLAIMSRQADEKVDNRAVQTRTAYLNHWHDRTAVIRSLEVQATQIFSTKLATTALSLWTQRLQHLQTINTQAVALRQETAEIAASSCLKKLGWRLFGLRRQEETALALRERNFEKHVRAMLRFWGEQTTERVALRSVSPTPSSRRGEWRRDDDDGGGGGAERTDAAFDIASRSSHSSHSSLDGDGDDGDGDETRRLEAWTAFDENALGLSSNLDLSLALPPKHSSQPSRPRRPEPSKSQTYPQSALKLRPTPILEAKEEDPFELDIDNDGPTGFWTSTPMPPTLSKPGYLKTPSKRSVVRIKRAELPPSPEKRDRVGVLQRGAMSAPPGILRREADTRGVTSFEARLREGGFGEDRVGGSRIKGVDRGQGKRRGKGTKVGFGNVSQLG